MNDQITPNKNLGQHWLDDKWSLRQIVASADVHSKETVIEIGPGLGTLTSQLLERGATVYAVEFDHALAESLAESMGNPPQLHVHEQDIRQFRFDLIMPPYKIVANIPYYLTSQLLRIFTESNNPPQRAVLLIQKEVAERVCAGPGSMSLLSVAVQTYFETSLGIIVPAALFTPPPKVDSQVLIMQQLNEPRVNGELKKPYFDVVKAGFSERRKMLRSSLSGGLRIEKPAVDHLLARAGIEPSVRAQELSIDQWCKLAGEWQKTLQTAA